MSIIHCTLQGKGGVGKTFVSTMVAQHQQAKGRRLLCLDTDPVNATFASYGAFAAQHVPLVEDGQFDADAFDDLLRRVLAADCDVVIDNGATSFVPFYDSLIANEALAVFQDAGKTFILHTVIAGGEQLVDTLNQFSQLAACLPQDTPLVVWLNEHTGPIQRGDKHFEQMQVYRDYGSRIHGILRLPKRKPLFETSIRLMREHKLTFDEAIASAHFDVFHKQRLKRVQRDLYAQLDRVLSPWVAASPVPEEAIPS